MENSVEQERETPEVVSQSLWNVGDQNQRVLTVAYFLGALLLWFILGRFFQWGITTLVNQVFLESTWSITLERMPIGPGYLLGGIAAFGTAFALRRKPQTNDFGLEVVAELKKVTWPPMDLTWKSTLAVIVTVIFCSIILGCFDLIWSKLSTVLLG